MDESGIHIEIHMSMHMYAYLSIYRWIQIAGYGVNRLFRG